ncbi:uncharacterized protein BT62DRAFT_1010880 [Guyanagaster necrorhizus]|uniref:Uncharacterized protein n=1 Tax=Guyanagaster necrorhizus TaxID=856835 RepID=A0A9P8ANQ4_9AGAR|nr:uncharacterized protein BT62DRAFT_1010880 [Guyanagaster necrorhizus MCA 3950]KAG7442099.1 hypothetical protein BT62DRAFT_1010880 [Guyanagaster necrorhizus MCA 3950]
MPKVERLNSTRSLRSHPYPRDFPQADDGDFGGNHETRRPVKHVYQLLNPEPSQVMPLQGIVQREQSPSLPASPASVPVSSSEEEESDEEDGHDHFEDDEDDPVVFFEEHPDKFGTLSSSPLDWWRGELDSRPAVRAGSSLQRSVTNGLQSFLGERIAPVVRASGSRLHAASQSSFFSSQQGQVRDSRSRNLFSEDPYIILFYGKGDESSQDSNLVEKITNEFLEIQDDQAVLHMDRLLDWWLARLTLEGTASFPRRMADFLRFVRRHEKVGFSTNSFPAFYKDCWGELRPLGTHKSYPADVPCPRTGCPWNVYPASATHIATRNACNQLHIDPDKSLVFVVFAIVETPRTLSSLTDQTQAASANQDGPDSAFYVAPIENSYLYTSTSLRPPATASWTRSYRNPPPRHMWNAEFADLVLIVRKLQMRPYTTCYKHYAIVWFQHEMCRAMGLQAAYGSQGGMDDVADWFRDQAHPPSMLLKVQKSTIQNWKAKVYSNTESLYVKFKSFIEKGGRIPSESERLYITVKVWVTNDPGAMIERGGFWTNEESIAMSAKGSGHLGALTDEQFAAQVSAHLRADSTWWKM